MLKTQYDIGVAKVNIYTDRPSEILGQLSVLPIRFFIVGQYNGPMPSGFNKVERITPDIRPSIVLSQTKLENFSVLQRFAIDNKAHFVHYETNFLPNISKANQDKLKQEQANVNVFSDPFLMENWGFNNKNSMVIIPGIDENLAKEDKLPYFISYNLPLSKMVNGICPIVYKTPYTTSIIKNAYNGFLYSSESELGNIVNKITKMPTEDVKSIGKNAKQTVVEKFPKEVFISAWARLIRSMI